jgi:hypothetical protein
MSVHRLPVRLDLEQLHRQAKELLRAIHAGDANAIAELREHHPESIDPSAATTRCLSRSKEKSVGIPHTYHDGSPEDRAHVRDFWTWLEQQPQHAWLYYARNANWDQAENMFVDMVRHPVCDRALASWLFWSSDPSYFVEQRKRPHRNIARCDSRQI